MSIDLDYWANEDGIQDKEGFIRFYDKVKSLNLPIFYTEYHDGILEHLNDKKVDHIYQIDYHNDIISEPIYPLELEEGTWAAFYKYKKDAVFEWRYPSRKECFNEGWGLCDGGEWHPKKTGYKKVLRREGLLGIKWNEVAYIGISLSPNWCNDWIYDLI